MAQAARPILAPSNRAALIHSTRTAVAGVVSWYVARLFRLPEAYWATITTMVVMQSELGAALTVSWQRFAGTALGAVVGGLIGLHHGYQMEALIFGATVFLMGLFCAIVRLDRSAYRFSGVTLAIILLISSDKPAWLVATRRFFEVTVGIVVALILTAIWPDAPEPQGASSKASGAQQHP